MSNIDTNGKRLNLFPMKKKKKKVSSNKAFDMMNTVADKSNVDINNMGEVDKSTKGIHDLLMVAGMTPALGNIADLVDASLYALEGEFGDAAWSTAAVLPFIGQFVSARRASKIVKRTPKKVRNLGENEIVKSLDVDGKSVGYIKGKRTSKGIKVEGIHVDEDYRRLGFGTDLYKSLKNETSGRVYSTGWTQNPKTAAKVWQYLVKKGEAEMIPSGMEPIYFLK
tara:strand:+ start:286 stop:957 length:672 start_codon:yes stop_codon:yes gene_type:complete